MMLPIFSAIDFKSRSLSRLLVVFLVMGPSVIKMHWIFTISAPDEPKKMETSVTGIYSIEHSLLLVWLFLFCLALYNKIARKKCPHCLFN